MAFFSTGSRLSNKRKYIFLADLATETILDQLNEGLVRMNRVDDIGRSDRLPAGLRDRTDAEKQAVL